MYIYLMTLNILPSKGTRVEIALSISSKTICCWALKDEVVRSQCKARSCEWGCQRSNSWVTSLTYETAWGRPYPCKDLPWSCSATPMSSKQRLSAFSSSLYFTIKSLANSIHSEFQIVIGKMQQSLVSMSMKRLRSCLGVYSNDTASLRVKRSSHWSTNKPHCFTASWKDAFIAPSTVCKSSKDLAGFVRSEVRM